MNDETKSQIKTFKGGVQTSSNCKRPRVIFFRGVVADAEIPSVTLYYPHFISTPLNPLILTVSGSKLSFDSCCIMSHNFTFDKRKSDIRFDFFLSLVLIFAYLLAYCLLDSKIINFVTLYR